jgi:conjugative relaxase-like TrwC/TraI family protein
VDRRFLTALLRGCDPTDGHFLPARKPARRRAGWDLTLAAPKSVSLLAATAGDDSREICRAHVLATDDAVAHFERRLAAVRRATAPGGQAPADGLVAAAFDHRINASGDPHLHTHLIVCNLGRDREGVWSALHSRWWTERAALGAVYQMSLRHHLVQGGLRLQWRFRDDGFAEVVGVPRVAMRAASRRGRVAAAERNPFGDFGEFGERVGRTVGIRAAGRGRSRWRAPGGGSSSPQQTSGFGPEHAADIVQEARGGAPPGQVAGLEAAVAARLAAQRSTFRTADVLVALAACTPDGMGAVAAERWVGRFCASAQPQRRQPGQAPRWTTRAAQAADDRLWACAQRVVDRRPAHGDGVPGTAWLADHPDLTPQARAAARELVSGAPGIHILGAPAGRTNLLAHAAVLEAAAAAWKGAGQRVAVATCGDEAARRWQVLTGIHSYRTGQPADVVVIDRADRRPTPELWSLLVDIDRAGTRAVLVEGGTQPRLSWRCSAALAGIGEQLGRLDPGPSPVWAPASGALRPPATACSTAADAAGHLLAAWLEAGPVRDRAVLVGLGYAETDGLNQAARAALVARGQIDGPALRVGERVFQRGDQALALRRLAGALPPATPLAVVEVDPGRHTATVTWDRHAEVLDMRAMAHVGYGYAVTPALAARTSRPLMVLGPADSMGPNPGRVVTAAPVRRDASRTRGRTVSLGLS